VAEELGFALRCLANEGKDQHIKNAIQILKQSTTPDDILDRVIAALDGELDDQNIREAGKGHLISVSGGIIDLRKLANKALIAAGIITIEKEPS
jgi:hypothetical protein